MNIEREFSIMQNYLNRYKRKPLFWEMGCLNGAVTRIEKEDEQIFVYGVLNDSDEKIVAIFDSSTKKGKDYKYWRKYHILEIF